MSIVQGNIDKIKELCASHKADKLYLFDSAETESFNESSDIDLLVRFKSFDVKKYFENYIDFKFKLESLFRRKVDLVEEQSLNNPVLISAIDRSKKLIYG